MKAKTSEIIEIVSAMAPLLLRLNTPYVVERWKNINRVFVPSYRAYIDEQIELMNSAD